MSSSHSTDDESNSRSSEDEEGGSDAEMEELNDVDIEWVQSERGKLKVCRVLDM
jgi:hypothetical protein